MAIFYHILALSFSEIYPYHNFPLEGHKLVYRMSGMYSPKDAPSTTAPGKGRSF
ncbi:unnamed protein product, partial [Heterosigma akashiwo]